MLIESDQDENHIYLDELNSVHLNTESILDNQSLQCVSEIAVYLSL